MNKLIALLSITVASLFLYGCGIKGPLYIEQDPAVSNQKSDGQQQTGTQEKIQLDEADSQPVLY